MGCVDLHLCCIVASLRFEVAAVDDRYPVVDRFDLVLGLLALSLNIKNSSVERGRPVVDCGEPLVCGVTLILHFADANVDIGDPVVHGFELLIVSLKRWRNRADLISQAIELVARDGALIVGAAFTRCGEFGEACLGVGGSFFEAVRAFVENPDFLIDRRGRICGGAESFVGAHNPLVDVLELVLGRRDRLGRCGDLVGNGVYLVFRSGNRLVRRVELFFDRGDRIANCVDLFALAIERWSYLV